ncbi:carbohydrate kinase family protein [Prochlorococcus marinus]|uniref:Carbohydrate kinase n=1 Tax=Prochlorococcus marinus XMU1408 TaxID=2213228 RepID=A0A318QWR6_PROMR|nr:carbohydrate kinase [Prochlorococcus marinus]MBW3042853.1 carbohydrate kinase [Prochlorococcus marinus str. XMU1408]PYE00679.1 carbohydrate kinase [Prochlorococcus marinus XMU1408]
MKSANVIAIGEALIDRLGPPGGDPSVDMPVIDCFGGAPANVACGLSRLGANVSFVGSLGNDIFGENFKSLLIRRGINTAGLQQDNLRPTRVVLVRRDNFGERFFEGFDGDRGMGFADQAISRDQIINDWPAVAENTKWLVIGTIPLASEISSKALLWCIENALYSGIKIALDLNWRPTFWRNKVSNVLEPSIKEKNEIISILKNVSLIKLAKEEAEYFFNTSNPIEVSLSLTNRPSVIITDGSNPISWLINNHIGKSLPMALSNVVDTTGAGDAFMAGLIYKLLSVELDKISKQMAEEIIQFAIACGAHVCKGAGAIDPQPYIEDIDKLLSFSNGGMS